VKDLDSNGDVIKPVVWDNSALYKKALFVVGQRLMVKDHQERGDKSVHISKDLKVLEEQLITCKINRRKGMSKRNKRMLLERWKSG
jgi:hypothetical protein